MEPKQTAVKAKRKPATVKVAPAAKVKAKPAIRRKKPAPRMARVTSVAPTLSVVATPTADTIVPTSPAPTFNTFVEEVWHWLPEPKQPGSDCWELSKVITPKEGHTERQHAERISSALSQMFSATGGKIVTRYFAEDGKRFLYRKKAGKKPASMGGRRKKYKPRVKAQEMTHIPAQSLGQAPGTSLIPTATPLDDLRLPLWTGPGSKTKRQADQELGEQSQNFEATGMGELVGQHVKAKVVVNIGGIEYNVQEARKVFLELQELFQI